MPRFNCRAAWLLIAAICLFLPGANQAQESDDLGATTHQGAQYYLGQADELLMKVNVWGFVRKPGQFMVPPETDLISLISFAGGPIEDAKIKSIKLIRGAAVAPRVTQSVSPPGTSFNHSKATVAKSSAEEEVVAVNVKKYLKTGDESLIPPLRPGDTVVVEATSFNTVRKVVDFAAKLAFIGQLYFWLNR